jgi:peptide/nickel transport system ATP-binding protein
MYAGHMVESAPAEDLIQNPLHPYTQLLLSAVPDPARGLRKHAEVQARGEVPNLAAPLVGCPFAPRCPHVMPKCSEEMPPITNLSAERWVRCYLYENHEPATM